jgi:hypothetical protein
VPVTATAANTALGVEAVAFLLNVAVQIPATSKADTTVVPVGMPVPLTDRPAPIAEIVVAKVTVGDPFVVVPLAVNTPTGVKVDPVNGPNIGRVFTVDEMSYKF